MSAADAFARVRPMLRTNSLLVASDFDGTIAHFVSDPWAAAVLSSAQAALRRLATTPGVHVALISGRTAADLAVRVRVGGVSYRGDHGAQTAEASRGFRPTALRIAHEPVDASVAEVAERIKVAVPVAIPQPWLIVEDKGAAVTFHFRNAPDLEVARARVVAAIAAVDVDGRLVHAISLRFVELRPATASTKGDTLRRLIRDRRARAAIMLGDDRNDALAFDALREARAAGHVDGLAIAVDGHPDFSTLVADRADIVLSGPDEAARLLAKLARATRNRD